MVGSKPLATALDRSQAITALTITELRCCGRDENDPLPLALREELR